MNKADFITQCERGAATLPANPVSAAVLRCLADQLKAGNPEWWGLTEKAWSKRSFVAWNEAWGLFLTAMHFEALSDPECPLVPYFPSCGGTAEADPSSGVVKFLRDAPDRFYEALRTGHRRTYVPQLVGLWPALATIFFHSRQLPFYVVEIGAGGGLNMCADKSLMPAWGDLVAARIGIDEQPMALEDLENRRWLTAALLPDSGQIPELDAAIESAVERQRKDANFLQLVECEALKGPKFIAKNIPADDAETGLLIMNVTVTGRMSDAEYQAYARDMAAMMKPWGDRALWLEFEKVRGEMYSTTLEARATRLSEGAPLQRVVLRWDAESMKKPQLAEAAKFLQPPGGEAFVAGILKGLPA